MASDKTRKDIDKATQHLIDFIERSDKWGPLFKELINQLCAPIASDLDAELDTVSSELLYGKYGHMSFGYFFEDMATTMWNGEEVTPIDTFLKTRGWREAPAGRRYLRALNESDLQLFEITAVEPGKWVEVRPFGTDRQSMRVMEKAASQNLHPWDALVARVYPDGKSRRFTGAMLPLDLDGAAYVQDQVESVAADLAQLYQELVDDGEDVEDVPVNFADDIAAERQSRLVGSAFYCFAIAALGPSEPVRPTMVNTDDEKIVMTRFRFQIIADASTVTDALAAHPDIEQTSERVLSWQAPGTSRTLLGQIEIRGDALVFQTNSVERGRKGTQLIESLLGSRVGPGMGVHENIATPGEGLSSNHAAQHDRSLQDRPEVHAALQSYLMEHYRRTLDEPIPMLDNLTPRDCAADPERRQRVVDWLKGLENSASRTAGPSTDMRELWTELGLDAYRPRSSTEE